MYAVDITSVYTKLHIICTCTAVFLQVVDVNGYHILLAIILLFGIALKCASNSMWSVRI